MTICRGWKADQATEDSQQDKQNYCVAQMIIKHSSYTSITNQLCNFTNNQTKYWECNGTWSLFNWQGHFIHTKYGLVPVQNCSSIKSSKKSLFPKFVYITHVQHKIICNHHQHCVDKNIDLFDKTKSL